MVKARKPPGRQSGGFRFGSAVYLGEERPPKFLVRILNLGYEVINIVRPDRPKF